MLVSRSKLTAKRIFIRTAKKTSKSFQCKFTKKFKYDRHTGYGWQGNEQMYIAIFTDAK